MKAGRLVVRDVRPVGDPVLDAALRRIVAAGPKEPESVLPSLKKNLPQVLYTRLSQAGFFAVRRAGCSASSHHFAGQQPTVPMSGRCGRA